MTGVGVFAALSLAACGQTPATPPADSVEAPAAAILPSVQPGPVLTIEASCRQAVERLYGQSGAAVTFNETDFSVSWPAPVDGGKLNFACSVVGSQVTLSNDRQTQSVELTSPASTPVSPNPAGGN